MYHRVRYKSKTGRVHVPPSPLQVENGEGRHRCLSVLVEEGLLVPSKSFGNRVTIP